MPRDPLPRADRESKRNSPHLGCCGSLASAPRSPRRVNAFISGPYSAVSRGLAGFPLGGEMRKTPLMICVVGGGLSGAAAAIACLAEISRPFRLVVIEPGPTLGRGVAYGAHHPMHLLNVRTRDLSVRASQPGDFLNWAFRQLDQGENHAGLHEGLAHTFLPRLLFGEYVRQCFFESVEARPDVELKLLKAVATACRCTGASFRLDLDNGEAVAADIVLLATAYGLLGPVDTGALAPFDALPSERLNSARHIALIGSGLTMVDVLMSVRRDGFQGKVTVISRRGQLPRQHAAKGVVPRHAGLPRSKRVSASDSERGSRLPCGASPRHALAGCDKRAPLVAAGHLAELTGRGASPLPPPCAAILELPPPSPAR